jgi:hypothetical protein
MLISTQPSSNNGVTDKSDDECCTNPTPTHRASLSVAERSDRHSSANFVMPQNLNVELGGIPIVLQLRRRMLPHGDF